MSTKPEAPVSIFTGYNRHWKSEIVPLLFFAQTAALSGSPASVAETVKRVLLEAVKERKDEIAGALLDDLEHAYEQIGAMSRGNTDEDRDWQRNWRLKFVTMLIELFGQMPPYLEAPKHYDPDGASDPSAQAERDRKGLLRTKLAMIEKIAAEWRNEENRHLPIYRFLISVWHGPHRVKMAWESDAEYERRKSRPWRSEERKPITDVFRARTGTFFREAPLDALIKDPDLPHELGEIAAIGRAKDGGLKLAQRDIRHAELLRSLEPGSRSKAAMALHEQLCRFIASRDAEVEKLLILMRPTNGWWSSEKIGASDYVRGNIQVQFHTLDVLLVTVLLEEKDSPELAEDVFLRAKRHVEEFCRETWSGRKVMLNVWRSPQKFAGSFECEAPEAIPERAG